MVSAGQPRHPMSASIASRRHALVAGLATVSLGALPLRGAWADASAPALEPTELSRIVSRLAGAPVQSIAPGPIPGLYEVVIKDNVLYIDATGEYLFDGQILQVATRQSLTEQRRQAHERAMTPEMDIAKLDLGDAIKTVYGQEKPGRFIVTFEDPQCGFCKRLHQTLQGLTDLVVYTFQVSFLGPESRRLNEVVWCSANRSASWDEVMASRVPEGSGQFCDLGALARNAKLADHYRVQGTPTIYTASGQRINGAVAAPVLLKAIEEAAQAAAPLSAPGRS